MPKWIATLLIPAAALLAGCMPSEPVESSAMDQAWGLSPDRWSQAEPKRIEVEGRTIPYLFRLASAPTGEPTGPGIREEVVTPAEARELAADLREIREVLEDLADFVESGPGADADEWAEAMATALVSVERIARGQSPRAAGQGPPGSDASRSAHAVMTTLVEYLDRRTGGRLLAGLPPEKRDRVRQVLVQVILRIGLATAGKHGPDALQERIAARLAETENPVAADLVKPLRKALEQAPAAAPNDQLGQVVRTVATSAPKALRVMEGLVEQWDRVASVELELRELEDQPIVSAVLHVKPGRELRVPELHPAQPTVALRGHLRITVQSRAEPTNQVAVLFEDAGPEGRAELRFEGLIYGLVRLLALPLASGTIREIRVDTHGDATGRFTHAAVLMHAFGEGDPRRIIILQDARGGRLERGPFHIDVVDRFSRSTFTYLTPRRKYSYTHESSDESD
jgi:hypothetical protein